MHRLLGFGYDSHQFNREKARLLKSIVLQIETKGGYWDIEFVRIL